MAVEVTRPSLQSWLTDPFDAFCYVSSVAHDYALHTPDEPRDNPFDIDQPGISCAIPSGWPGSFSDISCASCIVFFSRYASWLVGTLFRSNTSDSLHGDYMVPICNSGGR
ncbi:MAG: hypothetical protein MUO72_08645 [Bacteroidales bacterium]|nr:hypothetical protein [Bacteroidales bacterium]